MNEFLHINFVLFVGELFLDDCVLTGSIPRSIANLKNLGKSNIEIHQLIYKCEISLLIELNLCYHNFLSFFDIDKLYLSKNMLSSGIPTEIGSMDNLGELMFVIVERTFCLFYRVDLILMKTTSSHFIFTRNT